LVFNYLYRVIYILHYEVYLSLTVTSNSL